MSLGSSWFSIGFASTLAISGQPQGNAWKEIAVPPTVETNQQIVKCPDGWRVFDEIENVKPEKSPHRLRDISVYDGHPSRMASMIPDVDQEVKSKKRWISLWKLMPVSKDGSWIKCSYGGTRLGLCMPLPQKATEIRITSNTEIPNNSFIIKVEYR
jgi:hypothetical protein